MYWLITIRFGGSLQQPMTGNTFGCEKMRSLGNSSLKSREILGVHWRTARNLATMSLLCHVPRHDSPDGVTASFLWSDSSWILIPLCRDRVASPSVIQFSSKIWNILCKPMYLRLRVFSPSQLWSLKPIRFKSCPFSTANSVLVMKKKKKV